MATEASVAVTPGSGTNVDGTTLTSPANFRQTISIGDPTANAGLAGVDAVRGLKADTSGSSTTAVASGTVANTVVKASAGKLYKVIITTVGTGALNIFDNATTNSGTIIGAVAASAPVGTVATFDTPAANGITTAGGATMPAYTVVWS